MANAYKNSIFTTTGTGAETIYTVPAATVGIVKSLSIFNGVAGTTNLTIEVVDSSAGTTTFYAKSSSVAADAKVEILEGEGSTVLVLEEADAIKVTSSGGAGVVCTLSVLQQDRA
mgnify:FL=1|tara:strand:- start:3472 stop:3816 length:345 start_codon:yes stop_codon:yes gene_type:complete